jgi:hypothetical protein
MRGGTLHKIPNNHSSSAYGSAVTIITLVMSSCLCKKLEGAIFPFQVESLENGVNDSIHALHVHKANYGPGAAPDFHEAAFDDVGGS